MQKDDVQNVPVNFTVVPNHIAFILDGNRRWATSIGKNANFGHKKGFENIINLCNLCIKYNIKYLTLYCLSIENLCRSKMELDFIFGLMRGGISKKSIDKYHKDGVNISIIGDRNFFPASLIDDIIYIQNHQLNNPKLQLQLCFCYSGKNEIVNAIKDILKDNQKHKIDIEDINEKFVENYLFTKNIPDVDLMIRTGGDIRISNFLLWRLSYAEMYFCDKYFPIFNEDDFIIALDSFQNRQRRHGK